MSLINELREKSNKAETTKQEVIAEIKAYFDEYLDSNNLENFLKKTIKKEEIAERKLFTMVEFWEYHDGCSDTSFYCCGKYWHNPENSYNIQSWDYKGIRLMDIQMEICTYLRAKLIRRMEELQFNLIKEEKQKGRFGYFNTHLYFGW